MFSYFGGKGRIAGKYPDPKHDTIVEPFAGGARYSLYGDNWRRLVILRDVNPHVIAAWRWLQQATYNDVMSLPLIDTKQVVPDHMPRAVRTLLGYWVNKGTARPRRTAGCRITSIAMREQVALSLHKIRHWDIALGSHDAIPNIRATWFIDPPYQSGGKGKQYPYCAPIDYDALASWTQSRRGQVIACDIDDAQWLPFRPLVTANGQRAPQREGIWTNGK